MNILRIENKILNSRFSLIFPSLESFKLFLIYQVSYIKDPLFHNQKKKTHLQLADRLKNSTFVNL